MPVCPAQLSEALAPLLGLNGADPCRPLTTGFKSTRAPPTHLLAWLALQGDGSRPVSRTGQNSTGDHGTWRRPRRATSGFVDEIAAAARRP
jgi:hypothetical protein